MRAARAALGPLGVGIGVWCAAGDLSTATSASAAARVAVPASWWVFALALAAASLVPAWRRQPVTALPALLATLPWWPVPLPSVALLWTGPLAWLPIAAALVAGVGGGIAGMARAVVTTLPPARAPVVAAGVSLLVGLAAAWSLAPRLPGGDEPHYLIITQSLLADGDLRIENNHANRDYAVYYGGDIAPDYIARGQDGEIYSIHAPGVSALVAPAFAAFGYRGAQAVILLLAAVTAGLVWRLAFAATDDAGSAWFAWAAVALSSTFIIQSVTIFPDGPGALAVAVGALMLVAPPGAAGRAAGGRVALVTAGVLLALLPWLHSRFVVLAAGLGVAIVWRLWHSGRADRVRALGAFLAVPAVSAALWFGFFWVVYGTPSPTAPYGDAPETSWAFVPGGLLGLLLDQQFGLLVAAPVLAAALAGATGRAGGTARRWSLGIALVYFAVVCTYWMWWAGRPASPARFTAAALPLLAVPAAWAWREAGARARSLWLGALGVSLGISAALVFVGRGALAWNDRTANALLLEWLGPVVDLPRGLPSFFQALDPARLSTVWTFAAHVAMLLVIGALTVSAARAVAHRAASREGRRAALGLVALAGLMAIVQAGWWFNGAPPLDPIRGQAGVLAASAPGSPLWSIGPGRMGRTDPSGTGLRLAPEMPGRTAQPDAVAMFVDLPPMRARLHVADAQASGRATVRVGRSAEPFLVAPFGPGLPAPEVVLPAGATTMSIETMDAGGRAAAWRVLLQPQVRLPDVNGRAVAAVPAPFPAGVLHLIDGNVFLEPAALWVRGGTTATLAWAVPDGTGGPLRLTLRNGAVDNAVRVRLRPSEAWQSHAMAPSEEFVLEVPVVDGVAVLSVESPAGFRPADVSGGEDRRYLGVWLGPGR